LTCREGPFSLSAAGMLVVVVVVVVVVFLRLDVAVRVFMDDTAHAGRFLCLGGKFERDLE
jgi:hypothetical protein